MILRTVIVLFSLCLAGCITSRTLTLAPGADQVVVTTRFEHVQDAKLLGTGSIRAVSMVEIHNYAKNLTNNFGGNMALVTVSTLDINYPLNATVKAYIK